MTYIVKRKDGYGAKVFKSKVYADKFAKKNKTKAYPLIENVKVKGKNYEVIVKSKNKGILIDDKGRKIKEVNLI